MPLIRLAQLFAAAGHTLYGVGGMVRNPLLGLPVTDNDVTSSMTPGEVMAMCRDKGIKYLDIGAAFGMVELHYMGGVFQHTTFRRDTYPTGGGHRPQAVSYSGDINEDAFRRDFTVNAIYKNILTGRITDPTGGMQDLKNRLLRATSKDPAVIMGDDALRIMRMARFASELGFEAERGTLEAARACAAGLADISPERIREELDRILLSDVKYGIPGGPYRGLELLDNLEALDVILPELAKGRGVAQKPQYHKYDVLHHCFHAVDCIEPSLTLRLAALLHDVGKPAALEATGCMYTHDALGADIARGILERLRYPSGVVREVTALIRSHMFDLRTEAKENTIRLWLQEMGIERSRQLIALRRADVHGSGRIEGPVESADRWERILESMIAAGAPFEERQLAVTGADIAGYLGIPPSPRIGYIKAGLLRHCAKRPEDNNKTALLRLSRDLVNNS